ncbi:MAG: LAO/AO transport system kinase [Planctomycetota bacterium]|jgi:LAO/AO transport system kinase
MASRFLAGERGALARMISWGEDADERFPNAFAAVYGRVGQGHRLGVTGPPGAGKSTLVNELARTQRERERSVGVLAVDPSSPYSGGALLGDRIRMEERTLDPGVYIRSMASRGSHGGIARATVDAFDLMDAFGIEELIVETVGVGQAEYDVVAAADTVLVVLCPGAGDGIQAMKSGLLEVADVLCVNKSDQPGADRLARDLDESVHLRMTGGGLAKDAWQTPVVMASAGKREGIDEVWEAVAKHRAHLAVAGRLEARRRKQRLAQVKRVVIENLDEALWQERGYAELVGSLLDQDVTPYAAAARVLKDLLSALPSQAQSTSQPEENA